MIPALLLADIEPGGLIAIAFMVISFIGWVANLVNGQQKGQRGGPPARPKRPQDKRIRDEIDAFLQQAKGGPGHKPGQPQKARIPEREVLLAEEIEVPSQPRGPSSRGPDQNRKLARSKPRRPKAPSAPPPSVHRTPGENLANRHVAATPLGQSVQQHVQQHMAERVSALARQDVPQTVQLSVAAHMGAFAAEQSARSARSETPSRSPRTAAAVIGLLRTPQNVKHAVVLAEVLQPPLALRSARQSRARS